MTESAKVWLMLALFCADVWTWLIKLGLSLI